MFYAAYSLPTLCLMAALALALAMALRVVDQQLQLLHYIPTPMALWRETCAALMTKLNRPGRSEKALLGRGRVTAVFLFVASLVLGVVCEMIIRRFSLSYLEVIVLAGFLLGSYRPPQKYPKDQAAGYRIQIESGAVRLLQAISAPLTGWILLGWPGVLLFCTAGVVRQASLKIQGPYMRPIERMVRLVLYLPGIVAVLLLSLAALFTSKTSPLPALRAALPSLRTPHKAVLLTVADAMQIALGGPASPYRGYWGAEWIGSGPARIQSADVTRWNWLSRIAQAMLVALFLLLSVLL